MCATADRLLANNNMYYVEYVAATSNCYATTENEVPIEKSKHILTGI